MQISTRQSTNILFKFLLLPNYLHSLEPLRDVDDDDDTFAKVLTRTSKKTLSEIIATWLRKNKISVCVNLILNYQFNNLYRCVIVFLNNFCFQLCFIGVNISKPQLIKFYIVYFMK